MNIIIVFPKIENGRQMRRILRQSGFDVDAVCQTGAQALQHAHALSGGIVICGYRLSDMAYLEVYEALPPGFEMLLAASKDCCENRKYQNIICLQTPFGAYDLVQTVQMMSEDLARKKRRFKKRPERTEEEKKILDSAKALLMDRNHLTEEEAYRYLRKRSMDNGVGMVETAEMALSLLKDSE